MPSKLVPVLEALADLTALALFALAVGVWSAALGGGL